MGTTTFDEKKKNEKITDQNRKTQNIKEKRAKNSKYIKEKRAKNSKYQRETSEKLKISKRNERKTQNIKEKQAKNSQNWTHNTPPPTPWSHFFTSSESRKSSEPSVSIIVPPRAEGTRISGIIWSSGSAGAGEAASLTSLFGTSLSGPWRTVWTTVLCVRWVMASLALLWPNMAADDTAGWDGMPQSRACCAAALMEFWGAAGGGKGERGGVREGISEICFGVAERVVVR